MLKHKHMIVRAEVSNPPQYEQNIVDWVSNLIRDIDMKIMMGPYAAYCNTEGNRGVTCTAIIETSHVAVHVWDEQSPGLIQLDVYSCSDFAVEDVLQHLQQFDPVLIDYKFLDRDSGVTVVS